MSVLISTTTISLLPDEVLSLTHFWKIGSEDDPYKATNSNRRLL